MRAALPALALLSLAAVACGGTDDGRVEYEPVDDVELDQCKASKGYEFMSLVDFEPYQVPGGLSHQVRCNPEVPCSFYFNYDEDVSPPNPTSQPAKPLGSDCQKLAVAPDAVVRTDPSWGAGSFDAKEIGGGRCGEEGSALNFVTENVGMCFDSNGQLGWGAALDITFRPALDASEWDGVSFWVKNSRHGETPAIIVQFADKYTSGTEAAGTDLEPYCDASDPMPDDPVKPDSTKCDSFGLAVTLAKDWTFVPARFEDMAQKGFGVVSPLGHLKTDEIVRMQILVDAGDADFWVDNISLFRER